MGASITTAGESLIAQKQGNKQLLEVTQILFAFVPGLDTTQAVDRTAGVPNLANIVYTMNITRQGYLSPNQVVYSALLTSDIGDFDFNWMGLVTAEGTLLIAAYVPTQQKRKEIPPLQTGNNLTRNIVFEYNGAQALTGVTVPASTWQYDFTTEFAGIRQEIAALKVATANAANAVSLDGPVLIYPSSANTYKITDFNRFSIYTAATSVGTVAISVDTLTLTIPAGAAAGVVTLDVLRDGVKAPFKVALGASAIAAPVITSPANNAVGVSLSPTLTTSAFVAYPATADTHKSTDWRIKNAAGAVVFQSLADTVNKTSITLPANALQPGIQYFLDARHNGNTLGSSPYNVAVQFTTSAVSITTPTILAPVNGATGIEETPTITTSAFVTVPAASDTHKSTNWRLRNAAGDVIWSSMADTVNLTSIKLPAGLLTVSKNHTIDVQYNGTVLPTTPWQSSGFVTKAAFEFGKYLAVAMSVSPFVAIYGQDVDTFKKLAGPSSIPAGYRNDVCFSADGVYMGLIGQATPVLDLYKRTGDSFAKLAQPATLPTNQGRKMSFTPNASHMALVSADTTGFYFYKRSADTFALVRSGAAYDAIDVCFDPTGDYLCVTFEKTAGSYSYMAYWRRNGDELVDATQNVSLPDAPCTSISFSPDGKYLALGTRQVNTGVYLFKRSGGQIERLNANILGISRDSSCTGVAFSPDSNYLAIAREGAPYLEILKRNINDFTTDVDKFTKLPAPAVLPGGQATDVKWSADGNYLAVSITVSPYVVIYKRTGDTFAKLANPADLPTGGAFGISFYPPVAGS